MLASMLHTTNCGLFESFHRRLVSLLDLGLLLLLCTSDLYVLSRAKTIKKNRNRNLCNAQTFQAEPKDKNPKCLNLLVAVGSQHQSFPE